MLLETRSSVKDKAAYWLWKFQKKIFGKLKLVPLNYGKLQAQCGSWNLDSKTQWKNLPGRSWDLFWGTHPAHDDFQFIYKEWALGNQSEYPNFPPLLPSCWCFLYSEYNQVSKCKGGNQCSTFVWVLQDAEYEVVLERQRRYAAHWPTQMKS